MIRNVVHHLNFSERNLTVTDNLYAGDKLLDAWLNLTSTLWNTRLVTSMTFNEAHVLGILLRHSTPEAPLTATDLIRRTRLLKSQMNKVLTSLEDHGYISRTRADADKRMIHIHLTPEGETAYRDQHKAAESILVDLIDQIGAERALFIAKELHEISEILDDIVPLPK